ncbi:hypothetical protein OROMI_017825 [Orobanche minor]
MEMTKIAYAALMLAAMFTIVVADSAADAPALSPVLSSVPISDAATLTVGAFVGATIFSFFALYMQ